MLVLTRAVGEKVSIGDDLIVEVVEVKAGRVKLAFKCPKTMQILREELIEPKP